MVIYILLLFGAILLTLGLYHITGVILVLPSGNTKTVFRQLFGKRTFKQKMHEKLVLPLAKAISKMIRISEYKRRRWKSDLQRADIKKTPELYISENLSKSVWIGAAGFLFVPLGMPFITILLILLAFMFYRKNSGKLKDHIAKVNKDIEAELPRMVETLNYTLSETNDLLKFFERYRRVAGAAMGKALDRLIFNMKTGNTEDALREFDRTLAIPQITTLVSTLIGITHGIDQRTTLIVLEKDFRSRQREQLHREIDKRPGKVRLASVIMVFGMVILMLVPLIVMVVRTLSETGVL